MYVIPTPSNVPTAIFQLNKVLNKPKVSQLTKLDLIATFAKQLNAPTDLITFDIEARKQSNQRSNP